MKSEEEIERSVRKLSIEADAETQERILRDLAQTHAQQKRKTQAFSLLRYGRIIMRQKPKRIAAGIAAALLLAGLFSVGSGSIAFSQARHTVNSTLSWLKAIVTRDTADRPPALEQASDPDARRIEYHVRFFSVRPSEQGIWQSLKDSGIEFVQASAAPEVHLAVLSRQRAESFDALETLEGSPEPTFQQHEGKLAWIAMTGSQVPSGLAMGWLPTVSDDGTEIWSTVSFHDGRNGFEIPNVAMEPGGIVLIRAKGMWSDQDTDNQKEDAEEMLIQVRVNLLQTP